jgi:hypothetical protein
MNYTIETPQQLTHTDLVQAASLTALGFGRENNQENYDDTKAHLTGMDTVQLARAGERLAAFAAYRRRLWRTCD